MAEEKSTTAETVVTLWCAVYGEGTIFSVEIQRRAKVEALHLKIAGIVTTEQRTVPPRLLTLYLARKNGATVYMTSDSTLKPFLKCGKQDDGEYVEMIPNWTLDDKEYFGEHFHPGRKEIHVLVELPEAEQSAATLAQLMPPVDQGWTARWLSEFRKSQVAPHALPRLGELADFIAQELPVKITLHELVRAHWLAKMRTATPQLLDKLFRVDNAEPCVDFLYQIGSRVVESVDAGGTNVSFWGDLVSHVVNFVGIGKSDRQSIAHRPDYLCIVDTVCVFRGEERASVEPIEVPSRELIEKIEWSYGDAPYLFGYAAGGDEARLYALTHVKDGMDAVELEVFDAKRLEGRFRLLVAILNVARVLRSLASLCPESARGEYTTVSRDHGIVILLEPSRVVKCFPTALFQGAKNHAEAVYKVLDDHAIPNVDRLDHADQNAQRLVFKPRGQEQRPANLVELCHALASVLQALAKLHAASWMHRDIRWPNVIKSREDESAWFLVDFMDAAQSPQFSPSGDHLSHADHAPEIFRDGSHTTAVDVWSVGRLIQTCGAEVYERWCDDTGRERTQFLKLLMQDDPSKRPTAVAALDRLRQLEQDHLRCKKKQRRK